MIVSLMLIIKNVYANRSWRTAQERGAFDYEELNAQAVLADLCDDERRMVAKWLQDNPVDMSAERRLLWCDLTWVALRDGLQAARAKNYWRIAFAKEYDYFVRFSCVLLVLVVVPWRVFFGVLRGCHWSGMAGIEFC